MIREEKLSFERVAGASATLFFAGLIGAVIGGLSAGLVFSLIGAFQGTFWFLLAGFCAGVFGVAIGTRDGWAVSGAVSAMAGACAFVIVTMPSVESIGNAIGLIVSFMLTGALVPAICGFFMGRAIGGHLEKSYSRAGRFRLIIRQLERSRLYDLALPSRITIAFLQVLPVIALASMAVKHFKHLPLP